MVRIPRVIARALSALRTRLAPFVLEIWSYAFTNFAAQKEDRFVTILQG